jgi:hypothetical protein
MRFDCFILRSGDFLLILGLFDPIPYIAIKLKAISEVFYHGHVV